MTDETNVINKAEIGCNDVFDHGKSIGRELK